MACKPRLRLRVARKRDTAMVVRICLIGFEILASLHQDFNVSHSGQQEYAKWIDPGYERNSTFWKISSFAGFGQG